ncbi:probable LRR receptor-like serine/threonine-protein kinase At1g06840 isoform X1 [Amborella trichopoda]|nr:probable LRR receptor-like serine/threonine-protein kinase At1g06840 isoform X1 [Amborella trichopoda]|eukprot:XP_006842574.2 probable LRR receptor-like serine/threonine-protein kinase At1g06840 isoform X1 [Amborella trichopoda]
MLESGSGVFQAIIAFSLCFLLFFGEAQVTSPTEVSALRSIKRMLADPFKRLRNWNKGDPCTSNWTGISCFNATEEDGYWHVREVLLLDMNLSGTLAPEIGQLSYLKIFDIMWNQMSGTIPKEIGNVKSLELLLLNGNQLSGSLPEELGYLPSLNRLQIDQNGISGSIPKSFGNLNNAKHFHMNNNSLSGEIPVEISNLPNLVHLLLDNNNLTGHLPPELSNMPRLLILQLDNNQFTGSHIPASYANMSKLLKMSLRNCSLQGNIPDLSGIPRLGYLDLSWNNLSGPIPTGRLSSNITTIELAHNSLNGSIPSNFSGLPLLQRLSLSSNRLSGSVPSTTWQNLSFSDNATLVLDFRDNLLSDVSALLNPPANVTIELQGNPVCTNSNRLSISHFCVSQAQRNDEKNSNEQIGCPPHACPTESNFEYVPESPVPCFCAAPIEVGYRLKSPGISSFSPYETYFETYITSGLNLASYQLDIDSYFWEHGPRLRMLLKLFPQFDNHSNTFNLSEVRRIQELFTGWTIHHSDVFGPYELLNFTLKGPYANMVLESPKSGIGMGAILGIILGAGAVIVLLSAIICLLVMKRHTRYHHGISSKHLLSKSPIKVDGVKDFTYEEMVLATNNFSRSTQVGLGGYGRVYKGLLADGTVVAIKRAEEGSLQGQKEFLTELELLSRVHHRNLVSLVGYCDEASEEMLVYEFMPNGTLRDHLRGKSKEPLGFARRLRIALGSARGILYLHNEANPPIFHRDIKASNILLDSKFVAKVADFGLSRLAPVSDLDGSAPDHVSTVVKGTPGYLDPEYFLTHKLTDKSDVYSLGVVFLEILTGMRPISHGKNIVREVNTAYQSGTLSSIIDQQMGSYPSECLDQFMKLALRCCLEDTMARPSMAEVVQELENIWKMTPDCDSTPPDSVSISTGNPSSPASESYNGYGSDHISGVVPNINPR